MKLTPLRASATVIAAGSLVVGGGLLLGDAPTQASGPVVQPASLDIVPHPGDDREVVQGSPGSREQLVLLGGLLISLGALGTLGSTSAGAARRARESVSTPAAR